MQPLSVLMILEMLCVNLYVSHIFLDRRASPKIVAPVMAAFTLLLWGLSWLTVAVFPGYGEGAFLFCGFLYLLPLNALYRRGVRTTLSVMCLAWSYTMLVYLFSRCLGQMVQGPWQMPAMLAVQTAAYLLSLRSFLRLMHEKLLWVIGHGAPGEGSRLFPLSVSTCVLAFCANWTLLREDSPVSKLALVCALTVNTALMYQTLYDVTNARRHAAQTRQESLTDALTGLHNRRAFFEAAERLVEEGRPFVIVFLDLDRFKSINDTYGHIAGDRYLQRFAQEFTRQFSSAGTLYRIAGDEFVFLREGERCAGGVLEQICGLSVPAGEAGVPFLGFSCGAAAFPADAKALDELLGTADKRMYRTKTDGQAGETAG